MLTTMDDPRSQLAALCERGLDWQTGVTRSLPDSAQARHAAVLVLFGVLDSSHAQTPASGLARARVPRDLDVLLLRRAATLGSHPGQIAFPGGRLEASDAGPIAAALREAVEETGLDPAGVDVVTTLPALFLPPSGFVVTPVLAWWREPSPVSVVDPREVASVHRVPLRALLDPANRMQVTHPSGYVGAAFRVSGLLVWGFTAGLLDTLLRLGGWEEPWDRDRFEELPPEMTGATR